MTLQKKHSITEAEDVHGNGLVRNIKSLLAEEELVKIRKRTKDSLAQLKMNAAKVDTETQAKIAGREAA